MGALITAFKHLFLLFVRYRTIDCQSQMVINPFLVCNLGSPSSDDESFSLGEPIRIAFTTHAKVSRQ